MNIASLIRNQAEVRPGARAVVFPQTRDKRGNFCYSQLTFRQLELKSDYLAWQLQDQGIKEGQRVLLFVKPSLEFSVLTFALFKLGAVPVMIDPGMGKKNLLEAIGNSRPDALISVPVVHWLSRLVPASFQTINTRISTGGFAPGAVNLEDLLPVKLSGDFLPFPLKTKTGSDQAAILFTSGGTGKPKGVEYTHGIFQTQVRLLKGMFSMTPEDVDMPAFPLFSLMTLAMGVCSVIPPMNPARPAEANPGLLVQAILDQGVTTAAGSPAIWERVASWCLKEGLRLERLRSLMMFGAPVSQKLLNQFAEIMPSGETYTPYGATECLPVTLASGSELRALAEKPAGAGICVGRPVPDTKVKIIRPVEGSLVTLEEAQCREVGETGEILVKGQQVTPSYVTHPEETRLAKIRDQDGGLWHRMGDLGYLDESGRLWFCGRKCHRVTSGRKFWDVVPVEEVFNDHPDIKRTALVSLKDRAGRAKAALVIERRDGRTRLSRAEKSVFRAELLNLASAFEGTQDIREFFLHKKFPVDLRHNIKIDRLKLSMLCGQNNVRSV